jgi:prevent-host-death family protein
MSISASQLRQNIYRLLDKVARTGVAIVVYRKGKKIKIVPAENVSKLRNLKKRPILKGDPEEIVHIDWSREWKN